MIKVHDNRKTDERMLKNVEIDGYFMFHDVLCRRVSLANEFRYETDGCPIVEIPTGMVSVLDRMTWVRPLRDEQVVLSLEDWG